MTFYHSTRYPTKGLLCYIDAGNSTSYNGVGTTITDLSGNGNNWTIQGNVTWSATAGWGNFTGNSTGQGNKLICNTTFDYGIKSAGTGYTVLCWAYATPTSNTASDAANGWKKLIGHGDSENYIDLYQHNSMPYGWHQDGSGETLVVNDFGSMADNSYAMGDNIWRQWGAYGTNGGTTSNPSTYLTLGNEPNGGSGSNNGYPWTGNIAIFMFYNRVLSEFEIQQCYLCFKGRFDGTDSTAGLTFKQYQIDNWLPPINSSTAGSVLYNDGQSAFWAYPGSSQYSAGYNNTVLSTTVTAVDATTGYITCNSIANFQINSTFTLSGTAFGGLSTSTTYYITSIITTQVFTLSTSQGGSTPGGLSTATGSLIMTAQQANWRYRSILTHGYLSAGYKGSNTWRSINRTWHATDVTTYQGEQLDQSGAYIDGHWSDYNAYVHCTNDGFQGNSTHTSSYSLATGIARTRGTGTNSVPGQAFGTYNTSGSGPSGVGGWELNVTRWNIGACPDQIGQAGYVFGGSGGGTTTERMDYANEVMYTTTASSVSGASPTNAGPGQTRAWISYSGTRYYFTFSNQSFTAWNGAAVAPDGYMKMLGSKWGHLYGGNYSNTAGSTYTKFSDSTGTSINGSVASPTINGENNMEPGQDWGYMMGGYDGQQNNRAVKFNYGTDTTQTLGFTSMPKGHFGQSSSCCSSAAMSVCAPMGTGV
jgi:hypothetical protein